MPNKQQRLRGATTHTQTGAVLIIVLIMLALLSMTAATSMRNAQSTEAISGSTRNTELASQAAEIALNYCEDYVSQVSRGCDKLITDPYILPFADPPAWKTGAAKWDAPNTQIIVLPLSYMGATPIYKRAPECLMEFINKKSNFCAVVITARGFGPEVAPAGPLRLRPVGTEVWLQTHINPQTLESRSWRQIFLRQ
jgi:hypothetical protein